MSEVKYHIELRSTITKHKEGRSSKGQPVDFLRDVFELLKRIYGFDEALLKHIIQKDLIQALNDNDMNYLEMK